MSVSTGWLWLLGGLYGAVRNATAKTYHESDFVNSEFAATEKERKTVVRITPLKQGAIVVACLLIALLGAFFIQRDGNWNPFSDAETTAPLSRH
jgi:hypothetical protein